MEYIFEYFPADTRHATAMLISKHVAIFSAMMSHIISTKKLNPRYVLNLPIKFRRPAIKRRSLRLRRNFTRDANAKMKTSFTHLPTPTRYGICSTYKQAALPPSSLSNTMNITTYCNLTNFSKSYEQLHGVLSLTLCIFGSAANVLMMTVLLRKDMRWPTNLILAGLALADLMVMLEYIPFSLHRYFNKERRNYIGSYSYNWAIFMFFHALFSQIFHFISCCLTVILAVWRYVTISRPHNTRVWFGLKRTIYVIIIVYICAPIICTPIIYSLTINHHNQTCDPSGRIITRDNLKNYKGEVTGDLIYVTDIASETAKVISFWVYGVVIKLVPCILLTHLSWKLVSILVETKKRKKVLLQTVVNLKDMKTSGLLSNKKKKVKQADRTSNMLLALLFLFLITEFPQAILGLLSAILEEFDKQCYRPLETIRTDSLDIVIPSDFFRMLPLNKFCVKRFFEIGFINAANAEDEKFIDQLLALNKVKENITHLTFIQAAEVKSFFESVAKGNTDFEFPPSLMPELKQFVQYTNIECNDMETMMENMAYKLKFKLIQTMYEQYGNEVKEKRRQEILNAELDILADKKPSTRTRKPPTASSSKSGKKIDKLEKEDYTETELVENDLVIDDIYKNQVFFYIFRGFNNIDVLKYLLKAAVKLSFILKVSESEGEEKHPNPFWRDYAFLRNCPCDFLQNLAVFNFQAPPHKDITPMLESCLKEVTEIVKTLIDYKRLHFHYIRNLKIVNTKFTETFRKFPIYEKLMNSYPIETITIPLIINGMLQEVQMKQDKILKSQSFKELNPKSPTHKTQCPFDIHHLIRQGHNKKDTKTRPKSFKVYEGDIINLTSKAYEHVGIQYAKDNFEILKLLKPIVVAQECKFEETLEDSKNHFHDVAVPSEDEPCFTEEQTTHLINLLYLKNRFFHEIEDRDTSGNDFTKNLLIFNYRRYMKEMVPHCLTEEAWKSKEPFVDHYPELNQYQALRPMALHWAEILKPGVLLQYLLESELKFPHCDYIICELTNSLIVRYHYNVNSFGATTKVWFEYLRTPVGLADFCKFTLVDDFDWLKENRPFPQITYVEVAKALEEHSAMYQYVNTSNRDYKNLLVPQIQYSISDIRQSTQCPCIEENVCKILETCKSDMEVYPAMDANLVDILKDLEEYNNIVDFSEHCKGKKDSDYSFAAYNFGVTKFSVVGHTTHFVSLDNVKITVDTSRFCHDYFKMMVKITADYNSLVVHTPQKRFSCHIILSDNTVVVFSKPVAQNVQEGMPETTEEDALTRLEVDEEKDDKKKKASQVSETSNSFFRGMLEDKESTVSALDFETYSSLGLYPIVGSVIRKTPKEKLKTNIKRDVDLLKRLQDNPRCVKVSIKGSKRMNRVHNKIPEHRVTMSSIVKRILHNPVQQEFCETIKRKCVMKQCDKIPRRNLVYDCTVTVPNGLTLRVLPSELQSNTSVIKQSYDFGNTPKDISDEKYRMFTHDGTIIIGKLDGGIHLLMSSGRELRFTKPTNIKENEMFCRVKKDLTDGLIRKLFTRMTMGQQNPEASNYFISRRSHITSQYTTISSCESFAEVSKLPYSSFSMITFEGEKLTVKKNKLYKYQFSRNTTDINFQTEERYYRRDDGFSGKLDRDGTQYIEFPDGTSIRTVVSFSEEPIFINKKDKTGWILITSSFLYEHPFYKPVFFDNINSNIEIQMNSFDSLIINPGGGSLRLRNFTQIDLTTDHIDYTKNCNNCDGQYRCRLFVQPLYENRDDMKEPEEYFVSVTDSYKKTFKADFRGNCKVDPEYPHGPVNEWRCSHSLQTDHQRIYLIRNNLEGMILWNDKAASAFMKDSEEDQNMHHYNDARNNLIFLTITKNVFTKYNERFFGKWLRDIDFPFIKSQDEKNALAYQTTRNLYSMFELDQIEGLISCLKKFFQDEVMRELTLSTSVLKFHLSSSKFSIHSLSQIEPEETDSDIKPRISLHEKLKENNRKFARVRNILKMPLPNYFHSKFCTFVDPEKPTMQLRNYSKGKSEDDVGF